MRGKSAKKHPGRTPGASVEIKNPINLKIILPRKAERAGQIAEEKPTLTRSELRHLRSVLQEERDAANALGRAYDDVEQALAVELERMLAQWPRQESLSPHDALPQSQLLRNTFPQVSAYTPGDFVSEILQN